MEHSKNYKKVKKFYKMGIWSEKMVWNEEPSGIFEGSPITL